MTSDNSLVMCFGSFDILHKGHEYFISCAKELGENLIIVVAQDHTIFSFKKKLPHHTLKRRLSDLKFAFPDVTIIPGDEALGEWDAIKSHSPDIIVVGYDQHSLYDALCDIMPQYNFSLTRAKPYKPNIYKSSILRKKI